MEMKSINKEWNHPNFSSQVLSYTYNSVLKIKINYDEQLCKLNIDDENTLSSAE